MKKNILLLILISSAVNLVQAADVVTCKTPNLEIVSQRLDADSNKIIVTVKSLSQGDIIASFTGIDETDPYESDWPVLRGNTAILFSFFSQENGKPNTLMLAGNDLSASAVCFW